MLTIFDGLRGLSFGSVLLRILLATVLGTLIGLERSSRNRPAGFRTHILVCMGSSLAALTGLYLYLELKLPSDISRISAQVITGLGFIGAGTIIITKNLSIKGLTTAAGLWTTGIIGLAAGSGYYEIAIVGTALVLLVETLLFPLVHLIHPVPEYTVELLYNEKGSLDDVLRLCTDNRILICTVKIRALNDGEANYTAEVELRGAMSRDTLLARIRLMPGIISAIGL